MIEITEEQRAILLARFNADAWNDPDSDFDVCRSCGNWWDGWYHDCPNDFVDWDDFPQDRRRHWPIGVA